jgi:hypothetical protein
MLDRDDADLRMLCRVTFEAFQRIVGRSVDDEDQLQLGTRHALVEE